MAWVRVDDGFPEHVKVMDIGPVAEALWLRAMCYCNRNLTDGFVPAGFIRKMGDLDGAAESARLVAAGLWTEADGGWLVHDFLDYQPSKAEVQETSRIRAEAGRKGGLQKAANAQANAKQNPSNEIPNAQQNSTPNRTQTNPTQTNPNGEKDDDARPRARAAAPPAASEPFALVEALCDAQGEEVSVLSRQDVAKQCAAGKRLVEGGTTPADVRRIVGWLRSQSWVEGGVDLFLVEKQIGKWRLAGKPDAAPARRAAPNGRASPAQEAAERRLAAALDITANGLPRSS